MLSKHYSISPVQFILMYFGSEFIELWSFVQEVGKASKFTW